MADVPSTNKLADPVLLEAIDKLFELNIGEYVALPQVSLSSFASPTFRTHKPPAPRRWRPVEVRYHDACIFLISS